jgi:hypothetical protein
MSTVYQPEQYPTQPDESWVSCSSDPEWEIKGFCSRRKVVADEAASPSPVVERGNVPAADEAASTSPVVERGNVPAADEAASPSPVVERGNVPATDEIPHKFAPGGSVLGFYQHGDKRITKQSFTLRYHLECKVVEGWGGGWWGPNSHYWPENTHKECNGVIKMSARPTEIEAMINESFENGSLKGRQMSTITPSIERGMYLTQSDLELLKRETMIEWDSRSKSWIPSEVTTE